MRDEDDDDDVNTDWETNTFWFLIVWSESKLRLIDDK